MHDLLTFLPVLAAESGGEGGGGGSFLVKPGIGLMLWTLVAFGVLLLLLRKLAFPRIAENLDKRQQAIEDSIETAERTKREADELLADARHQAEDIVARARKAAEVHERDSLEQARTTREELMAQTRRDIEAETRRAIQEIRNEVADLTVLATEKVTRKSLNEDDQRRLVEEALSELDFDALAGDQGRS
jgi:F-type H+-transporting ATPase subunit b